MSNFIIATWPLRDAWAKSGGIRVLHELAKALKTLGHTVYMINVLDQFHKELPSQFMIEHNLEYWKDNCALDSYIVIYPEGVPYNFLNAKKVVWYLLNRPMYVLGNTINYGQDDLVISYSKKIDKNVYELLILLDDRSLFYAPDEWNDKENMVCIYFDKGKHKIVDDHLDDFLKSFDKIVQINRQYPADRLELASLLRRSKLLVVFDPLSAISFESLLSGTPVYFINDFFNICSGGTGMNCFGMFNNLSLYEIACDEVPFFQLEFELAIQGNIDRIKQAVGYIESYFEELDKMKKEFPLIYSQLLDRKLERQELDNYRYLKYIANNNSIFI